MSLIASYSFADLQNVLEVQPYDFSHGYIAGEGGMTDGSCTGKSAKRKHRLLILQELAKKRARTKLWLQWETLWDLTLQEVLDEEEVLQECKAQTKRLIEFLTTQPHMEELVNYITQEPTDETDEKVRYKYPNAACELLTSDVDPITDKLVGEPALINTVYTFIENDAPLNPLLASFFSKVMGLLISRRSEQMLKFLQSKDDFIGHLLRHIGTSAIMDLLLRLITCIENPECHMMCLEWLNKNQLIQRLVAMIDPSQTEEKQSNACQSLCDVIRLSREQISQSQRKAEPDPLLSALESEDTVTDLLSHMFDGEKVESVFVNGLVVIQYLLEFKKLGPDGGPEVLSPSCTEFLRNSVCNTVSAVIPRLKDFHQLLNNPPKQYYSPMVTTVGTLNPPFGNTRLQIARLITLLLFTRIYKLNVELATLGTLGLLIELGFKFTWNNLLHTQVEQSIAAVLHEECTEEEEDEHKENPLLSQLFTEYKLFERILQVWEDNDQHQSRPGGHRRGYMGHATKIANHIVECMEKGQNSGKIKGHFEALPDDVKEQWNNFVSGSLSEINKQNTVVLAGQSMYSSSEEEDSDFTVAFLQDTAMQQAFSDYQLQQMTSNFIDQFGFNEEDFGESEEWVSEKFKERISSINFDINTDEITNASTLFDQVCNEKIQQFDDQDSEEDLWEDKEITFSQSSGSRQNSTLGTAAGQPTAPATGTTDSDSSDSEEELDSPRKIHQTPTSSPQCITADSTTEKMDVDNSEGWANFDDISMETTPALSATDPGPDIWRGDENNSGSPATSNDWAKFNSESNAATIKVPSDNSDTPLADFTSLEKSGNTNSETQRSRSPVAMDTNESSNPRVAAYLVSSAPADLASNIGQSTDGTCVQDTRQQCSEEKQEKLSSSDINSDTLTSSNTATTSDISSTQAANPGVSAQPDSSTSANSMIEEVISTASTDHHLSPLAKTPETTDAVTASSDLMPDDDVQMSGSQKLDNNQLCSQEQVGEHLPESETLISNTDMELSGDSDDSGTEECPTKSDDQDGRDAVVDDDITGAAAADDGGDDDDDDDLGENFNFLASAGLMTCADEPASPQANDKAQADTTQLPVSTAADQKDLERIRAQAKEALDQFNAATSTVSNPSQNGPV
ncbi:hypothetical protein LSH36_9g15052 [Paralvinella palmiformis]|uniref:Uncharacterized protein n=1 Tax=Paralvinella palmiformis TaxID=53620 RepID=A0AAD9NGU1_9ANNE|nr:hypothetical protein LSH36_9g15052 [Paralvinella palmiformis]